MRFEIPEFKRCCFCIPLRYGLLVWAYLMLLPIGVFTTIVFVALNYFVKYQRVTYSIWLGVLFLVLLCNLAFTLLLIVAAHKKSIRLLKIYYMCAIGIAFGNFVLLIANFVHDLAQWDTQYYSYLWFWEYMLSSLTVGLSNIGMQLYIIALVRSEIIKLLNSENFEFSNIAAKAESAYYEPETVKIENSDVIVNEETNKQTEEKETD